MDLYFDEEEEEAIAKLLEEIEQKQLSRMVSEKNEAYASPQPCASLSPYQEQDDISAESQELFATPLNVSRSAKSISAASPAPPGQSQVAITPNIAAEIGQYEETHNEAPKDAEKSNAPGNAAMYRVDLGDKAGLHADRQKVNQVIYEMSKNSKYFQNEQRKSKKTQKRVDELLKVKAALGPPSSEVIASVDAFISSIEAERDLSHTWLHVDMDAFYAAVEIRDDPSLKGKPIAVGGMGMITTSSYEARKFGVRSAMPGFIGKELCPDLIFVKPNFEKYKAASKITREIFALYDPEFEPLSLDEAGLNITPYLSEHPDKTWEDVTREIRALVFERTSGLTCSVGIGCNRRLAKMAADVNKPDGFYRVPFERAGILAILRPMPVRKLSGVGKVTEQLLHGIGVFTVQDLYDQRYVLSQLFSESTFRWFLASSLGIGGEEHTEDSTRKSVGRQRTFGSERSTEKLRDHLKRVCALVASDMEKKALKGRCVTLVFKTSDFEMRTRARTINRFICSYDDIYEVANEIFEEHLPLDLRLIGVRLTQFESDLVEKTESDGALVPLTKFFTRKQRDESVPEKSAPVHFVKRAKEKAANSSPPKPQGALDSFFKRFAPDELLSPITMDQKKRMRANEKDAGEAKTPVVVDLTNSVERPSKRRRSAEPLVPKNLLSSSVKKY